MTAATPSLMLAAAKQQQQQQQDKQAQEQMQAQRHEHAHAQMQAQQQPGPPGSDPTLPDRCVQASSPGLLINSSGVTAASDPAGSSGPQVQSVRAQDQPAVQQAANAADCALDSSAGQDYLQARLQQYVSKWHVHLLGAVTQFINTLSPYQNALMVSLSYPWLPNYSAVADVLSKRCALRLSQQALALQSAGWHSRSCSPPAAAAPPSTAATAVSDGGAGGVGASEVTCGQVPSMSFLKGTIQQYQERRMQELQRQCELCWSELSASLDYHTLSAL
jgi:hypothetical protein